MFKRTRFFIASLGLSVLTGTSAIAECETVHTVGVNDTIFSIAERYFDDHQKWSVIYYANQSKLDGNLFQFTEGTELNIPCLDGNESADLTPLRKEKAEMTLLTGSNYAPFTDRAWVGEGMLTEVVNAALENSPYPVPYAVSWENDWTQHLFPKLDSKEFDMGFPWARPICEEDPEHERCANFHFSDPLFEYLFLLFVKKGSEFTFETDSDIAGKSICRPAGYFTQDLDRADRRWITNKIIDFVVAPTADVCFEKLLLGEVDAVSLNEFSGWTKVADLGIKDQVKALNRPVSIQGLHVIISKKHWRGTTHLYRFNAGLEALKKSKRYDEIIAKHLSLFWDKLDR